MPPHSEPPTTQVEEESPAERSAGVRHDPYAALRLPDYRRFAGGWIFASMGLQMQGMALGWEVYERTHSAFQLGLVGLLRALPVIALALPAGHVVDTLNRKKVLIITQLAFALVSAGLAAASFVQAPIGWMYLLVVLSGCARVFNGPSRSSLLPQIVPSDHNAGATFHNAVTWNAGVFHISATIGPLLAGQVIAMMFEAAGLASLHNPSAAWPVYACSALGCLIFAASAVGMRPRPNKSAPRGMGLRSMLAGMAHLWNEKTILAAISLDLFAVLLGGATALLPVYAKDILHVGPLGLGALRAATPIGALLMTLILAHRPPFSRAGPALLWSVAGFGLCIIVFGLSRSFILSMAALLLSGALDNISVVIRHVLVQMRTPEELRGRVSAVNSVFIESSNELGAFESGLAAKAFAPLFGSTTLGAVASVVSGGIGTILVVIGIGWWLPEIRRLGRLREEAGPAAADGAEQGQK
ncbi:MAG: MFS transporter [Phycisphaerales bacterium]|nr:MFS transporter [Phycisphaerales bacterium]